MEGGFSAHMFKGTRKEYDEAIKPYVNNNDLGKITGCDAYPVEEWEKLYPPKEPDKSLEGNNWLMTTPEQNKDYRKWKHKPRIHKFKTKRR